MKNIRVVTLESGGTEFANAPEDTMLWTYNDRYIQDASDLPTVASFYRNNGIKKKLVRFQADYHPIMSASCNGRVCETDTAQNLVNTTWKSRTVAYDMFNRTGNTLSSGTRLNLDWKLLLDRVYNQGESGETRIKFNLVTTTRWALYGTKPVGA